MLRCSRTKVSVKPSAGQARDDVRFVTRQSVTTLVKPACAAHEPVARPMIWASA